MGYGIVLSLVGFSLATGLLVGQLMRLNVPNVLLLLAFVLMCVWWGWMTMRRARALRMFRRLRRLGRRGGPEEAPLDEAEIEDISPPH